MFRFITNKLKKKEEKKPETPSVPLLDADKLFIIHPSTVVSLSETLGLRSLLYAESGKQRPDEIEALRRFSYYYNDWGIKEPILLLVLNKKDYVPSILAVAVRVSDVDCEFSTGHTHRSNRLHYDELTFIYCFDLERIDAYTRIEIVKYINHLKDTLREKAVVESEEHLVFFIRHDDKIGRLVHPLLNRIRKLLPGKLVADIEH